MINVVLGLCIQPNLREIKVKVLKHRKDLIDIRLVVEVNKTKKMQNLQLVNKKPEENYHIVQFY